MIEDNKHAIRISHDLLHEKFVAILLKLGFESPRAEVCASIFVTNSLEGIYTHGVNRFARFVNYVKEGYIKKDATASLVSGTGSMEQWNGNLAPGPINAVEATNRAMTLASQYTMGCVALNNTNHWMRGGYYGWQAVKAGYVLIAWTNTTGNTPAWGAKDSRLGNNPLVLAVPFHNDAIVLDMAMSQYSYGALDLYKSKNEALPTVGGYDQRGNLTDNPAEIIASRRVLPIGYWKGAGLSLLLDILATILSNGLSTAAISKLPAEYAVSQVFIAIDIKKLANYPSINATIQSIIDDYHHSSPLEGRQVRYPGERIALTHADNLKNGIPIASHVWEEILAL